MRIAIHQPNFCPVKGYFDKIAAVDLFVIMTHCQWEKGKYQNRFHVGDEWNTMAINHGLDPIKEKVYTNHEDDWMKIVSRYPKLETFSKCISSVMWSTNCCIIRQVMRMLNLKTKIAFDFPTHLRGTQRLVEICQYYEADEYLSGVSGKKYLDLPQFDNAKIKVSFQENPDLTPLINLV